MSLTFVKLLVCASHARFCLRDHEGQYTRYCDHQYMVMKMKKEKTLYCRGTTLYRPHLSNALKIVVYHLHLPVFHKGCSH